MPASTTPPAAGLGTLQELYGTLDGMELTPGWVDRKRPILYGEPFTPFKPMHWRWRDIRPALDAAGRLINTELAERRNFVMRNSAPGNDIGTTRTLVSAYQMIMPGEKARSHRHAPHALRVIIEAEGAYSTVDGEKTPMETGDVVLTPGWSWHGHGHDGAQPAYWFDGLDVPLNHLLEPMFFEVHPDGFEEVETVTEVSPNRFSRAQIEQALENAEGDADGFDGPRIALEAPTMPTMSLKVHRWDAGTRTRRHRASINRIYSVMRGEGTSRIGDETFHWQRGDTIAAPIWSWVEHEASDDAAVFCMTDEPLMRFAHYYRVEAG